MNIQTVLTTLTAHSGLAGIVASRIYRGRLPQNPTYPLILFRVTQEPENDLDGNSDLSKDSFEFELYGSNYAELEGVKTQLHSALMGSSEFEAVRLSIADDDYQDNTGKYSIFIDYSIW